MAVYRETIPTWRRRLPLVIVGGVLVIVVIVVTVLFNHQNPGNPADAQTSVSATLDTLGQSVDLFDIEYNKVRSGTAPSQTGAPGAIHKALDMLNSAKNTLRPRNALAYEGLQTALNTLNAALVGSSWPDVSAQITDAQTRILTLRNANSAP